MKQFQIQYTRNLETMELLQETMDTITFEDLGLNEVLLESLRKAGFKTPSPIQQDVIPLILEGHDVIGHAQTGTGKTAAFSLPALHGLKNTGEVEILVITPTRELASQVSEEISRLGGSMRIRTATVYGGKSFTKQIDSVRRGAQVVVATPGRLLDLLQGQRLGNFAPSLVVIDEADEMLDMGFLEDLQAIFSFLPEERQTLMFSATMPTAIQSLAKTILRNPRVVKAVQTQVSNVDIAQNYCLLHEEERDEAVVRLFEAEEIAKGIIFCKTKKEVDRLSQVLTQRGHAASGLHGDMEQGQREQVIHSFRSSKCKILVATDVAARGLSIADVSHVINYHIPFDAENYVHRIGRTGRAGRKGVSITFVTPKEYRKLLHFQKHAGGQLQRFFIPSKEAIQQAQVRRLIEQLMEQNPSTHVFTVIDACKKTMDLEMICAKFLGLILAKNPINGPETIGIQEDISTVRARDSQDSRGYRGRSSTGYPPRKYNSGRMERTQPNSFGQYPKKKFAHPGSDNKKAKKRY